MEIQTSFETWLMLLGGALSIGVIGLAVGIIHDRRQRNK
jgi:hypothetical protein